MSTQLKVMGVKGGAVMDRIERLNHIAGRLARCESTLGQITDELYSLILDLRKQEGGIPCQPPLNWGQTGVARPVSDVAKRAAMAGLERVDMEIFPDGSARLRATGYPEIKLPADLATLLGVLMLQTGPTSDHLVNWKSISEVQMLLTKKTGRAVTRRGVICKVHRLRNRIEAGGGNRHWVQANRKLGYRFALRTGAGAVTQSDLR